MQVAILLYPNFTALDVMGPYEVLARLPDTEVVFVAEQPGLIVNDLKSVSIDVAASIDDVDRPDVVLVGGGPGQAENMQDGRLHEWLRAVDRTSTWTTSVCTGSLILAAAGVLKGRRATSHWLALDQLGQYGVTPSTDRVVIDGHYASAAGVSAGIDMALTLAGLLQGDEIAQTIQLIIEYAPEPPYGSGSQETAPPAIVERAKNVLSGRFSDE
jgi:transcriptional regulator GlxA family with amidase domain